MPKRTDFKMALKMGNKGTCLKNKQPKKQNNHINSNAQPVERERPK